MKRLFPVHLRVLCFLVILAVLVCILSSTQYFSLRNQTQVAGVDHLSHQRIGCCVGWETDILLSDRSDLTLLRYDTNADGILALGFGQVDAFGCDEAAAGVIFQTTEGLERLPDPIARIGLTLYTSIQQKTLLEEFNEFAAAFAASDEYEDFHNRAVMSDGEAFKMADIPKVTDGKTITVGYVPEYYPQTYFDTQTGQPAGYAVEIALRFAYAYGYTIRFVESSETSALVSLSYGKLDMVCSGSSDVYRKDVEAGGAAYMTEPFMYSDVYLLKLQKGKKLVMKGTIDY